MLPPEDKRLLTVDMVLDPICPWCFVGFRALDWALMALSFSHAIEVRYRPYRLDPETPTGGRDREAHLAAKFPDPVQRNAMRDALATAMADVGLSFDPARPSRIPDTTLAHRLMRWAQIEGVGKPVLEALFEAYWIHGEDIGQVDVLVQIAETIEMDGDEVRRRLASKEDAEAVRQEAQEFRAGGVTGVPTFIVNEAAGFAGALPKAQLFEALKMLAAETSEDADADLDD